MKAAFFHLTKLIAALLGSRIHSDSVVIQLVISARLGRNMHCRFSIGYRTMNVVARQQVTQRYWWEGAGSVMSVQKNKVVGRVLVGGHWQC